MECGDIINFLDYSKETEEKTTDMMKMILDLAKEAISQKQISSKSKNAILNRLVSINQIIRNQKLKEMIKLLKSEIRLIKFKKKEIAKQAKENENFVRIVEKMSGVSLTRKVGKDGNNGYNQYEARFKGRFMSVILEDGKVKVNGKTNFRLFE